MASLMSFEDVIGATAPKGRHLLLGNGFSRACRNDIFSYVSLFDRADFGALPLAQQAFEILGTTDFEAVMRALQAASKLVELYGGDQHLAARIEQDAIALREVMVQAIAENHPDHPAEITDEQYRACREFLSNFESFYTLNYDLLLYWALMHTEIEPEVKCDDGFRTPDEGEAEYVTWEPEKAIKQVVHYLHGGLHIFDERGEVQKYTWSQTGIRLIEQIRSALSQNKFPIIVAEGETAQKEERIWHSGFLHKAYRSFVSIGGVLVVYGHGMNPNDEHILEAIAKSKVQRVYVGIYGDPESSDNQRIMQRAMQLELDREHFKPGSNKAKKGLAVSFYDAASAHVWG